MIWSLRFSLIALWELFEWPGKMQKVRKEEQIKTES